MNKNTDINIRLTKPLCQGTERVISHDALAFITVIHRHFFDFRFSLLKGRTEYQEKIDLGDFSDLKFLPGSLQNHWITDPVSSKLRNRCIELTGSPTRKTLINGLNSGADVFIADFDDALSPTWENILYGQQNIRDAVFEQIDFTDRNGKHYVVKEHDTQLFVRPRGLHLDEKHVLVDGQCVPACIFDVGIFIFNCSRLLLATGKDICFYIPKIESVAEAQMWNDLFSFCEQILDLPSNSIKAVIIIESIPAVFAIDYILFALRGRSAGLSCGRWDYIFSHIRTFNRHSKFRLPDRHHFHHEEIMLRSLAETVVNVARNRNSFAIGGMSTYLPKRGASGEEDGEYNLFLEEKTSEATAGFNGTWVAHPSLVRACAEVFSRKRDTSTRVGTHSAPKLPPEEALLLPPKGMITTDGLRRNVRVSLHYFAEWILGNGALRLDDQMEDTATAEISRSQIWQCIHNDIFVDGRGSITIQDIQVIVHEEFRNLHSHQMEGAYIMAKNMLLETWQERRLAPSFTRSLYEKLS